MIICDKCKKSLTASSEGSNSTKLMFHHLILCSNCKRTSAFCCRYHPDNSKCHAIIPRSDEFLYTWRAFDGHRTEDECGFYCDPCALNEIELRKICSSNTINFQPKLANKTWTTEKPETEINVISELNKI